MVTTLVCLVVPDIFVDSVVRSCCSFCFSINKNSNFVKQIDFYIYGLDFYQGPSPFFNSFFLLYFDIYLPTAKSSFVLKIRYLLLKQHLFALKRKKKYINVGFVLGNIIHFINDTLTENMKYFPATHDINLRYRLNRHS